MILKLWFCKRNNGNGNTGHVWTLPSSSPQNAMPGGVLFEHEIGEFDLAESSALVFNGVNGIINSVNGNGWHISHPSFMAKSQILAAVQNSNYSNRLDQTQPVAGAITPAQNTDTGENITILLGTNTSGQPVVIKLEEGELVIVDPPEWINIIW